MMEEIIVPVARNLRNDRCDGLRQLLMPRQEDVPYTSYLDARKVVLNVSEIDRDEEEEEKLPSIREMLQKWYPLGG